MEVSGRTETASKGDDQDEIFCQPCQGEGDEIQAEGYCENCNEYFCSSCIRFHRKMSATKYHVIKTNKDMPRNVVKQDSCVKPCHVHKTEIVKYYCSRHDSVGCGDCMVIDHTTCKVELVRDVSGHYGNCDEINMIKQEFTKTVKKIGSITQEMKGNFTNAAAMKDKVKKEIRQFWKELNTYIDQEVKELLKEVDRLHSIDVNMLTDQTKECHSIETEIKQFQQEIHQYEENINQLFVTAKQAMESFKPYQEAIKRISSKELICEYKFEPTIEIQALTGTQIGTLSIEKKKCIAPKKLSIEDMTTQFVGEIKVQAENESNCSITGMALISSNEMLLADFSNKSMKILNVQNNSFVSKCVMLEAPWDVTVINTDLFATTLPEENKILFMKARGGLSKSHTWDVKEWCRGIDYHNGKIAVSFSSYFEASVEVLNMTGKVLFHADFPGSFDCFPMYLAFNHDGSSIFLSDEVSHVVHEKDADGQLKINVYSNLNMPQGLACTGNGTIVLCNQDDGDKLTLLVPKTREVKTLYVKHVKNPTVVIIDEETSTLYVYEQGKNSIKTFALY